MEFFWNFLIRQRLRGIYIAITCVQTNNSVIHVNLKKFKKLVEIFFLNRNEKLLVDIFFAKYLFLTFEKVF